MSRIVWSINSSQRYAHSDVGFGILVINLVYPDRSQLIVNTAICFSCFSRPSLCTIWPHIRSIRRCRIIHTHTTIPIVLYHSVLSWRVRWIIWEWEVSNIDFSWYSHRQMASSSAQRCTHRYSDAPYSSAYYSLVGAGTWVESWHGGERFSIAKNSNSAPPSPLTPLKVIDEDDNNFVVITHHRRTF